MYPTYPWSVVEDRDRSRAAAERYHQLQAVAESQSTTKRRPRRSTRRALRRLFAVGGEPS